MGLVPDTVGNVFKAVRDAAVGAGSLDVTVPAGAVRCMVYSSVNAIFAEKGVTAATGGFDIPADVPVGGLPIRYKAGGEITITARSGNLAIVSVAFEIQ